MKKGTSKQTYILDVDDLGFLLPGLDDMIRLRTHYPEIKFTCFTIPLPKEFYLESNRNYWDIKKYKEWAKIINSYEWIQVALHGFSHTHNEMAKGYDEAIEVIDAAEKLFNEIGLNYVKLFKAPYWQYSYASMCALKDRGYTIALDRNNIQPAPEGAKTYVYDWSFEEVVPPGKVIKGHGHLYGNQVANVIGDCFTNIVQQIPQDAKFKFIL